MTEAIKPNPKYTEGLNLDPEMEQFVQKLMAEDPYEEKYLLDRLVADAEFEELRRLYETKYKYGIFDGVRAAKPLKTSKKTVIKQKSKRKRP